MSDKQLELDLGQETEQQTNQRVWRQSQTASHLDAERRDYTTLAWSNRIAAAVEKRRPESPRELIAGTIRHSGNFQEVVLFLDQLGHQRCQCRAMWEANHDLSWHLEWQEQEDNHNCLSSKARKLLRLLESGE